MDAFTEARLDALTLRLDTPVHRVLAALVGGGGTVAGVGLAGLTKLTADESLRLRWPHAFWFALEIFAVGTTGGAVGHYLILKVAPGTLERRAFTVGGPVGLATAATAWALTYYGRSLLSPFRPGPDADRVLRNSLKLGLTAGPVAGVAVSLIVIKVLKMVLENNADHGVSRAFGSSG